MDVSNPACAPHQSVKPSSFSRNVANSERVLSLAGGGCLVLMGLRRGSAAGLLGIATGASLLYRGWTGHCHLYEGLGINTAQPHRTRPGVPAHQGSKVHRALHINRNRQDVYDFWRNFENLPRIMQHLESVTVIDDKCSQWVARAPLGKILQWKAEIITDKPGEVIAWQSLPGSQVDTAGSVHFNDSSAGGTDLVVSIKYNPPGGRLVTQIAHLLGQDLQSELDQDLKDLKQLMEAGEIATNAMEPDQVRKPL
ncbi:SRPBCC family protein [Gimesia sp.]|uniref:SRPBCC family protein n=1 Tax=Gimesia sp. TaxID=2024833 RepID=UPI003A92B4C5